MSTQLKYITQVLFLFVLLFALFGLANIWLSPLASFRTVFGSALLLFVPGLPWTYVLLPRVEKLERLLASIALSIVSVPLAMYAASKLGIKPSTTSILVEIAIITLIGLTILFIKKPKKKYV